MGPKLGEGEFSNVYEVTSFKLVNMKHGLDSDISITLDDNGENFIVDTTTATNDDDLDEKKTESLEKVKNNTEKEVSNSSNAIKDLSPEEYDKRHHIMKEHML